MTNRFFQAPQGYVQKRLGAKFRSPTGDVVLVVVDVVPIWMYTPHNATGSESRVHSQAPSPSTRLIPSLSFFTSDQTAPISLDNNVIIRLSDRGE